MSKTCFYFAYGSNLLSKRMYLANPKAKRYGIGVLNNYALTFGGYGPFWDGAVASIRKREGHKVWGVVWVLNIEDLAPLDRQEGVQDKFYYTTTVEVECDGKPLICRTYIQCKKCYDTEKIPKKYRPSHAYLHTIIKGAEESQLPSTYIEYLKTIPVGTTLYIPDFLQN